MKDRVAKLRGGNAQPKQEPQSQPATNKAPSLGDLRYGGNSYRDNNNRAGLGSLAAGAVRGAGSIGATLLLPADMINQKMRGDDFFSMKDNNERRQAMTDGLETMGADTDSLMFKGGKLAAEIAGTAGIGGSAGGGITKIGGGNPLMNKIGNSVASGGLDLGVKGGNMLANGATRVGGGAINGALTAGAADPESMGVGAAAGGALPVGVAGLGGAGKLFKGIAGNYSAANRAAGQGDDLLANAGQNPLQTIENLRSAQGATEGFNPTTWQAAGNADMAGFGRVMHGKEGGLLNERLVQQRQALADAVRKYGSDDLGALTGTDLKRDALVDELNAAVKPLYEAGDNAAVELPQELLNRPAIKEAMGMADINLANAGKKSVRGETVGNYPLINFDDLNNIPPSTPFQEQVGGELLGGGKGKTLLQEIRKMGGVNQSHLSDITGEKLASKARASVGLFNKSGKGIDDLASQINDMGYIPPSEMQVDGGVSWLKDAIKNDIQGEKTFALNDLPYTSPKGTITHNFPSDFANSQAPSYFGESGNKAYSGKALYETKMALDKMANMMPSNAAEAAQKSGRLSALKDFNDYLDKAIPAYGEAKPMYQKMSRPINQLDLGNEVTKRFIPAGQLDRAAPNELKYDALARALRNNGDQLARSVTGFKGSTLQNTAGEQQLKDYADVLSDTNYLKNADMGKMGGSSTYQNMELAKKANPLLSLAGSIPIKGVNASMLKAIKDKIYSPANKTYKQEIIQALLEPKTAAQLMQKQLTKKQVPSALIDALKNPAIRNALPLYLAQ